MAMNDDEDAADDDDAADDGDVKMRVGASARDEGLEWIVTRLPPSSLHRNKFY